MCVMCSLKNTYKQKKKKQHTETSTVRFLIYACMYTHARTHTKRIKVFLLIKSESNNLQPAYKGNGGT